MSPYSITHEDGLYIIRDESGKALAVAKEEVEAKRFAQLPVLVAKLASISADVNASLIGEDGKTLSQLFESIDNLLASLKG